MSGGEEDRRGKLEGMSNEEFVEGWRALVGEPPAVLLDSRRAMIRILVQSSPQWSVRDPDELGTADEPS